MALIRAEIRQRLGDSSIYDGIVEYQEDFEQERMLASVHPGSLMLCLNCQDGSDSEEEIPSDLYVKREDGSWEIVSGTGASSDVTADAVASAIGDMDSTQVAQVMASLGAEPEKLVITVTKSGGVYSADKTWTEITTAYNNGKVPVVKFGDDVYELTSTDGADFVFSVYIDFKIKQIDLAFIGRDVWSYEEITVQSAPSTVTVSGTTPTITPSANTVYNCGELTSLTVSNPTVHGFYTIKFDSGSTPTAITIPSTINGLENFVVAANTHYEIVVENNYAQVKRWPDTSSGAVSSVNGKTGAVTLTAEDVSALPNDTPIPAAVTEQTVSGWGFTKNTGTYTKPASGIPKTDLASAVQTSLEKADTALQSVPSGYATENWVTNKGYQTAAQVQTAIAGVRQLPVVSTSDNGKFLRVISGAWAAVTVPSAETASF